MKTIKQLSYFYLFRAIVKFDKFLELFTKVEINHLGSSGIKHTICIKGNKFYQSCRCGSKTGRC
jgi:hypothetical protein